MQTCTKEEIKLAMTANNISVETLRNYLVEKGLKRISISYLYHILNGTRESQTIESAIWGLLGEWIEQHRIPAQSVKIELPEHLYPNNNIIAKQ